MSQLQAIKKDQIQARKNRETVKVKLLTTLLSEASKPGLDDGKRESTDVEVIQVVKKFIKNINESLSHYRDENLLMELDLLNVYLPSQLSEEELEAIIRENCSDATNMGQIMGYLKKNNSGQYDGKTASTVAKRIIG